ncbi:hypothetical protein K502DRAFT_348261 [Neoconidiobolus thromboides FSU 785]|nr:hypothetical protein K502DRAFT_348261 [Neoconidiobolus thromboides FSU 785]
MNSSMTRQDKQLYLLLKEVNVLKEKLNFPLVTVSEASKGLIDFTTKTKDYMLPNLWGNRPNDPFAPASNGFCQIL